MKYFTIAELSHSDTATRHRIDNSPDLRAIEALKALTDSVLDPLRKVFGKPICVNSGYRCPVLNRIVGGAATSQHTKGEAADISGGSKAANRQLFKLAIELHLPFDQLIDEHGYRWLHVSHRAEANRRQIIHNRI